MALLGHLGGVLAVAQTVRAAIPPHAPGADKIYGELSVQTMDLLKP